MSGGGTKLLKGRMGSRIVADVSPAQLEAMEKSLENETKAAAVLLPDYYRVFSLTWPASMQMFLNKRNHLHKKRVHLPQDWFGTPTWPPFHCFGTPIWPT